MPFSSESLLGFSMFAVKIRKQRGYGVPRLLAVLISSKTATELYAGTLLGNAPFVPGSSFIHHVDDILPGFHKLVNT